MFFSGLDDGFDQVREEILRKDPPVGLQAAYAYVRREANRKEAMKMEGQSSEPVAMAAKAQDPSNCTDRVGSENKSGGSKGPAKPVVIVLGVNFPVVV